MNPINMNKDGSQNTGTVSKRKVSKITVKLFAITTFIFLLFIAGTLLIQSLFFEKYYISKKKNEFISNVKKFKVSYDKAEPEEKNAVIKDYEDNSNIKFAIVDSEGKIKFMVKANNDKTDSVKQKTFNTLIKEWINNKGKYLEDSNSSQTVFIAGNKDREVRSIVNVIMDTNTHETIFAITSLQPVSEAVSTIKEFYIYFAIGAVVLILVLSLLYSNILAKPLIKINRTAKKMSELDFSESCEVTRKDELGSLAAYLNSLSFNLNNALSSLREANSKLEQDIEKERQLEKMRKEFVTAVSHELKTPISLIDGYATGLKDNIFDGEDKDYYLDVIIDEARKMDHLVRDMLNLSQLESGGFKLMLEEVHIAELIESTMKKYTALASEKSIEMFFRVNVEAGMEHEKRIDDTNDTVGNYAYELCIGADVDRIEQVLTNFMTNALKHTESGGKITISLIEGAEAIRVEVENTGVNIPEEEMPRLWDRFYKADRSRSRSAGGTGMGLAIVKNILNLHNAKFGVENTDCGVKFYFEIPKYQENI